MNNLSDVEASSQDISEVIPNDVLRLIYTMAVELRDIYVMEETAGKVARGLAEDIAFSVTGSGVFGFFSSDMSKLKNSHGFIRQYGMGRVITLEFLDRTIKAVVRIKQTDGVYSITDHECITDNEFAKQVVESLVNQFNSSLVLVNKRRPNRSWVRLQLRDKIIEDLSRSTNISVYRLQRILDG
jgi:hypothetical protein